MENYPNWAHIRVVTLAAASGTALGQLVTGITNLQKVAWAVHRMEVHVPPTLIQQMTSSNDYLRIGITNSNSPTQSVLLDNAALLDMVAVYRAVHTAVATEDQVGVYVQDYGMNPLLLLPQVIYGIIQWAVSGVAAAVTVQMRVYYKEIELGPQDWYDLLQLRLPLGAL